MDIGGDTFDIRDAIERFEELESERENHTDAVTEAKESFELAQGEYLEASEELVQGAQDERDSAQETLNAANTALLEWDEENGAEFKALKDLLDETKGMGGDHEWRGDWYPVTFIADSYFEEYAEEYANDIGAIDRNAVWPANCIDWEQAAKDLQVDYSTVELDGTTYWYR